MRPSNLPRAVTARGSVWLLAIALAAAPAARGAEEAPSPGRVEGAVEAGLAWLAEHQAEDGSWDTPSFPAAVTSLAGMAFLANGHVTADSPYRATVDRAVDFVRRSMRSSGYIGTRKRLTYVHGLGLQFVASYLGTTRDPTREQQLANWVRDGVKRTLDAQKLHAPGPARGGWRYSPSAVSTDLWASSWVITALRAARQAGYQLRPGTVPGALDFLDGAFRETKKGGYGFVCRAGVSTEPDIGATAAAIAVKIMLKHGADAQVERALPFLTGYYTPPAWSGARYRHGFYWDNYYIALALFQAGGEPWRDFRAEIRTMLVEQQQGDGHWGFPPNNQRKHRQTGKAFPTAMAVLMLSLEKQYLPVFQRPQTLY